MHTSLAELVESMKSTFPLFLEAYHVQVAKVPSYLTQEDKATMALMLMSNGFAATRDKEELATLLVLMWWTLQGQNKVVITQDK